MEHNYSLAVIMTCHNRSETTVNCVQSIMQARLPQNLRLLLYITDDGCTDMTAAKLLAICPEAKIQQGDGTLYWCGGMRLSMNRAIKEGADFVLWLNDDVLIFPDALERAISTYRNSGEQTIVIGTTVDPQTQQPNYGPLKRASWLRSTRFVLVPPTQSEQIETMSGQFVLIPSAVARRVGEIDFIHHFGDVDYGRRAKSMGVRLIPIPQPIGFCPTNPNIEYWREPEPTISQYWRKLNSPKGLPLKDRMKYCRRHSGLFWWIPWLTPYVGLVLQYPFRLRNRQK